MALRYTCCFCFDVIAHVHQSIVRREAAHALAKMLVTTNPTLLSEHARLGSIRPLLYLCRENDSTELQQFEALLAVTNIISCGSAERSRFDSDRSAHWLLQLYDGDGHDDSD